MKKHLQKLLLLMALLVVPWVTQGQSTLTVNDGTQTNDYVPIYGYMADDVTRSQFVIPASDLTDVVNNLISKLTFYSGTASKDWGGSWKVYLKEISSTTLTAYQDWSSLTEVYSGSLSIAGNQMVVEFQDGFLYLGGNLLVGVYQVSSGNWLSSVHWQGVTASSGASLYSYGSSSGSAQSFLPKVTIEYASAPSCFAPIAVNVSNVERRSFDVTWTPKAGVTNCESYEVVVSDTELDASALESATKHMVTDGSNTYHATGLTRNTTYYVYVRSNCGATDGVSEWVSATATTSGLTACADAVVANGTTTHTNTPLDFYNTDGGGLHKAQFLYPASLLSEQGVSGTIKGVTFYDKSGQTKTLSTTTWTVKVGATTATDLSSGFCSDDLTTVYSGNYVITSGVVDFTFDNDFEYEGGNLIVEISCTGASGNWYSSGGSGYYGVDGIGSTYSTKINYANFLPKTAFFCCVTNNPCPAVETVSYELTGEGTTTATVSWTASTGDYANTYDVYYGTTEVTDFTGVTPQFTGVTALSQDLTGLSPYTDYYVYVMCHCDGEGQNDGISTWNGVQFKTNSACRVVTDLDVVPASKYTATATWTGTTQANNFQYVLSTTELTDAEVEAATPTFTGLAEAAATLTGLVPEQTYYLYVANNCTGEGVSPYIGTSFTMPVACAEPANLAIANLDKYSFTATWNADTYADATDTYDMIVSETELDDDALASATVTYAGIADTSKTVELLQRGTTYYVYVRGNCGVAENGTTDWVSISTTTLDIEPDCDNTVDVLVANGTTTHANTPLDFYNTDVASLHKAHFLYPASLLSEQGVFGTIKGVTFYDKSGSTKTLSASVWTVKVGTTTATDLSSGFCTDALTTVYSGDYVITSGVVSFPFDNYFDYTGGNLVVEISCTGASNNWYGSSGNTGYYGVDGIGSTYSTKTSYTNFLPKTLFSACVPVEACPTVDAPEASNVEVTTATLTWNEGEGDFASSYDVLVSDEEITDFSAVVPTDSNLDTTTYDATGLTGNTTYYAYVRVNCVNENYNDGSSTWSPAGEFTTELPCRRPTDFADTRVYAHAVDLTWMNVNNATAWQVGVVGAADTTWQDVVNPTISNDTVSYQFTGLTASSAYHFLLRANCSASGDGFSGICFDEVNITTISDANDITAFSFSPNYPAGFQMENAVIDTASHTINVTVLSGTDLTTLEPYVFSTNSLADNPYKINGAFYYYGTIDFSSPVVVTVYAEDTTLTQNWIIAVNVESCATPESLTINNVERRKMTLNWTLGDTTATNFDLVVSETEITDLTTATPQSITVDGDSNSYSYTIEGLTRNTQYYIYIRTNCGAEQSHWANASQKTPDICNELQVTVANGTTTNSYVPIYGNYCDDANVKSQSIYPESMLTELVGMTISSMKYFVSSGSSTGKWDNVDFTVKMGTTTATSLASGYVSDATQTVYVGHVSANTTNGMVIDFDTPFLYTGGNLVIEFSKTVSSGYNSCYFYGSQVSNASYNTNSSNNSAGVKNFLPKVQFSVSACDEACPAVDTAYAELTGEGMNTATVHWTESKGDYANTYDVIYSETEITDFTGLTPNYAAVNGLSQELSGLDAYTIYYVYVRANCDGEGQNDGSSTWYGFNFRTNAACHVPHDLAAELTNTNSVSITWTNDQDNNFRYILSTTPVALENLETTAKTGENLNATSLVVDNLDYETEYHFYLSNACGGSDGNSPWDSVSFSTLPQCTAVVDLMASDTAANSVRLTWTNGQFCNATSWQVTAIDATDNVVYDRVATDTTTLVFGLAPETAYTLGVRAICGTGDTAAATTATITTMPTPSACVTIGTGTSTDYAPICGYYGYERNGYIFTPADGISSGVIASIAWNFSQSGTVPAKIYMKNTDQSSFSATSSIVWNDMIADATLVYDGTVSTGTGWKTIDIDDFEYIGENLMILVASNYGGGGGSTAKAYYTASGSNNRFYGRKDNIVNDAGAISSMSASGVNNQRHNIQICFENSGCNKVANLVAENVTVNGADISWTPGGSETSWNVYNSATELDADALAALTATDYVTVDYPAQALSDLTKETDYYYYVQANCSATESGDWKVCHFMTLPTCSAPLTAVAVNDAPSTLTFAVSAGQYGTAESYNYEYWAVGDSVNGDTISVSGADTLSVAVAAFNTYGWRVQANCGATDGLSRWTNGNEVYVCGIIYVTETNPLIEGGEDVPVQGTPTCWTSQHVEGVQDFSWRINLASNEGLVHSSLNIFSLHYMNPGEKSDLVLPQLNIPTAYDYEVSFWLYRRDDQWSKDNEGVSVWINSTPDTVGGTKLLDVCNYYDKGEYVEAIANQFYQYRTPIPAAGDMYVIFEAYCNDGNAIFMDDISVNKRAAYNVSSEPVVAAEGSVLIAGDTNTEGKYFAFDTVTLTATAVEHYHFHHWTTSDDTISMVNPLSFVPTKDTVLNAVFAIDTFTVALAVNDTTLGTVDGDSVYTYGTIATLTAEAIDHYHFRDWTDTSANVISTDNPASITVERDTMLIANFAIDTHQLALTVMPLDVMGSVADVNGYYNYGDSVNISATANYGYFFTGWSDNVTANERRIAILSDTAIAAQFDSLSYTITAQTADAVMGAVTGTATQKYLTTVTLEATPEYGYHFVAWNDGNTDNPRTVTVERDSIFTASFDSNIYTITAQTADAVMGAVTGTATQKYLTTVTLEATPEYGYHFVAWNDGNTDNPRTLTVERDSLFTASFDSNSYTITAQTADAVMGAVTGTATQKYLTTATIEATPEYGYHFVAWNDGNTDNPRTVTVERDSLFTASFDSNVYTVTILADLDEEMQPKGDVTGSGEYKYLSQVDISVEQRLGFYFLNWSDGDVSANRTITVTSDTTITAMFSIQPVWAVSTSCDTVMGTVTPRQNILDSLNATIEATANYGYHFVSWNDGVTDNPRTLQVVCDTAFTAVFDYNQYTIDVASANSVMGSVTGIATKNYLQLDTIEATANYGYHFTAWNDGNTDNPRIVTVERDSLFTASFDNNTYTVTVQHDTVMGTIENVGEHRYLDNVIITAVPNVGYHLDHWDNGSESAERSFVITCDTSFVFTFAPNVYALTVAADNDVKGTVSGNGNYNYNTNVSIAAVANYGYAFHGWNDGNVENPREVNIVTDSSFTALFDTVDFTVTALAAVSTMGTVAGSGDYAYNTVATITATPNYGYSFTQWSDGNTTNPRNVTVVENATYTAEFAANNYVITVNGDAVMGIAAGTGSYAYNSNVQISATANYGYHFTAWNDGNTDNPRTVTVTRDSSFTAQFAANSYNVAVVSDNSTMGSVAGAGSYDYNTSATISATANYGYSFTQWSDGNTTNPRNVVVTRDSSFTAQFAANNYNVTVATANSTMGTVTGTGSYAYSSNAQIGATANYGYHFTQWNDGNTDNPRTVVVIENATYTAQFAANSYNVAVVSDNSTMGSVAGAGSYDYNTSATISATANYGYSFTQWSDGNTTNPRNVVVTRDSSFTAQFAANNYNVTVATANSTMGTVTGTGSYAYSSNAQIGATANYGYHFTQWNDGNTDNPRTVVVIENATYTAQFAANSYNVAVVSDNSTMGSVAGAGSYDYNTSATISATANYGYSFTQWSDGNTTNPRNVVVTRDSSFTAQFAANNYNVTVATANSTMGTVTGTGSYAYSSNAQIGATANYGYNFMQWNDGNTDNPRTVVVTENVTYTAQFAANSYHITALSANSIMGTVAGTDDYTYNTNATLTATANYGYHFVAWNDGNTTNPRTVVVTENATYTAEFAANTYTLTVNGDAVMGTASGSGSYNYGETVMISATANYGYHFTQWSDGNVDNPRTVLVDGNITLAAQFSNNGYQVTTAVTSEAGSGSITGAGNYEYGEIVTLTATATPCYHFVAWNDGVTEPVRTVTVTSDMSFTAEFALNEYSSSFSEVVCDSYEWAGITYTESVVETRVFQTANGCDSTVTMTLTVNYSDHITLDLVESGSYTWNDVTYDQSGVYVQNFTNASNCDSIVTINLTIYGTEAPEIVDFNGMSLMVNHYPNGSTEYVDYADYRWYRDGQLVASGSDTYVEGNGVLNGCYYVEIPTDASKTVWDRSNTLCFRNGVGIDDVETLEVSLTVAPNPVRSGAMMTVTTDLPAERLHGATLIIYDLNGREVNRISMERQSVRFNAEQTSGTYTVVLTTEDGVRIVKRVVVR